MPSMQGIVTIVQEGRFELRDDAGVSHTFLLSYKAAAEPEQLPPLQRDQARIRVEYQPAREIIGMLAHSISRLD